MKKVGMLLGCGLVALAIGCGDSGSSNTAPPVTSPDPAQMRQMMEKNGHGAPPAGVEAPVIDPAAPAAPADPAGEKKEDPAAEKKEDAPAEKKEEEKKE